jgi:RNase P/RNase MRP subunit p29
MHYNKLSTDFFDKCNKYDEKCWGIKGMTKNNQTKRYISLLLIFIMVAGMFVGLPAVNMITSAEILPPVSWSMPISTRAELEAIVLNNQNVMYHLTNDIDLGDAEWTPLGNRTGNANRFRGTFDGQGYAIRNLYVLESSNQQFAGLFGRTDNATIRNVGIYIGMQGITAFSINNAEVYAGGLIGRAQGNNGWIDNCYVTGNVTASTTRDTGNITRDAYAGGLIGRAQGSIQNCYATGNIIASGRDAHAGGLIGRGEGTRSSGGLWDCYATGNVSASTIRNSYAGGLIGRANNNFPAYRCYRLSTQEITGNNIGLSGSTINDEQMRDIDTFRNWNFDTIWGFQNGVNNDFPILQMLHAIAVTGVEIDIDHLQLDVEEEAILTATVFPDEATTKNVRWSSSDWRVATVNRTTGEVKGISAGEATITATTVDGGYTATCEVIVTDDRVIPVTGVTVNPSSTTIQIGTTEMLTATVLPNDATNKNVTWYSSNSNIATVDRTGVVRGVREGTVTITVKTRDGNYMARSEVTVFGPPVPEILIPFQPDTSAVAYLPSGTVTGASYNWNFAERGFVEDEPIVWRIYNGNLPIGLELSEHGVISGTPLEVGEVNFTVTANSAGAAAHRDIIIEIGDEDLDELEHIDEEEFANEIRHLQAWREPAEPLVSDEVLNSPIARYTVLVLDRSGSMSGDWRELVRASKAFIDYIEENDPGHHIAIVPYADGVTKKNITQPTDNYSALRTAIDRIPRPTGGTNMLKGLEEAEKILDALDPENNECTIKQILLMSDGLPNNGRLENACCIEIYDKYDYIRYRHANYVFCKAKDLKAKEYDILTIGLFDPNKSDFKNKERERNRLGFAKDFMGQDLPSDPPGFILERAADLTPYFEEAAIKLSGDEFELFLTVTEGGIVTDEDIDYGVGRHSLGRHEFGTPKTLIAKPNHGYRFVGWYDERGRLLWEDEVYNFRVDCIRIEARFVSETEPRIEILKLDTNSRIPLANATFTVENENGEIIGTYTTDASGKILITDLPDGTYIVRETIAPPGYILNETPRTVVVTSDRITTIEFTNAEEAGGDTGIEIIKLDKKSRIPLVNATFTVENENGEIIGTYITDASGRILITKLSDGTYIVRETIAPFGYIPDETPKTVVVTVGAITTVEFTNEGTGALIRQTPLLFAFGLLMIIIGAILIQRRNREECET